MASQILVIFRASEKCLVMLCILLHVGGISMYITDKYVRRLDRRIEITNQTDIVPSKVACMLLCTIKPDCDKITWNATNKHCQIAEADFTIFGQYNSKFRYAVGWTSYENIRFSVSSYDAHSGRYKLTYHEGVEMCIAMGTTIASRLDLLKARDEGFEACQCGWLSEGYSGFVLQEARSFCWNTFIPDIQVCANELADVYCKMP